MVSGNLAWLKDGYINPGPNYSKTSRSLKDDHVTLWRVLAAVLVSTANKPKHCPLWGIVGLQSVFHPEDHAGLLPQCSGGHTPPVTAVGSQ